jgi:hypothetical protein
MSQGAVTDRRIRSRSPPSAGRQSVIEVQIEGIVSYLVGALEV